MDYKKEALKECNNALKQYPEKEEEINQLHELFLLECEDDETSKANEYNLLVESLSELEN